MAAETVTVLFTDLVGSTELLSRVGEAGADELRRDHFGLLRAAMAEYGGREVKNLGDGLMVVFDGVASALDAAVAMQQAITIRPPEAEPLSIKIGVAVGDAEREEGDYFGLPVVEAARLCAKAEGGEILTTEFVRMLAKSRSNATLESIGPLELKGIDEPVETYRVRWVALEKSEERPPLPARLASSVSANFVGRSEEHEQLAAAWKAVAGQGERRVVLVSGEPGIGKTTLSARFACEVYDEGAAVVYGRCDEDLGIPYQPWIESLTQLVAHAPERLLVAHIADRGGHLARLVPEIHRRVPVEVRGAFDADSERFVLFECIADLLERISAEQPVLLVLDDLHWADRPSIQLLRHVVMSSRSMRIGMLGTFRDSDITSDHALAELLAALHRESGTVRLALRGLGDDDLLRLLETVAGHEMDEQGVALRDAILAETAGNPFFVAEILRHLAETGAIYQQDDGRWVADADLRAVGLPVSVREVVGRRLSGLGPDTERVLGLGAVIGRDFDIPLLAAVAQLDQDVVIDICDAAVDAAVLQTTDHTDRYTFAHALIEHTLYDGLSPARRGRAHKAVAVQLEAISGEGGGSRVGELAYHWAQAVQPTDVSKAVHYAEVAAARALGQLAPDEALRWFTQALELFDRSEAPDPRQRAAILVGLGEAQRQCGIAAHRETLLEAARVADTSDAVDLVVRAVLANNRGFQSIIGDVDHERIAAIDRALECLGDAPTAERAQLLALAATERTYLVDLDERLALAEEAVTVARASGDRPALLFALTRPFTSITHPSTLTLRAAWMKEACEIADALGDGALRYWAYNPGLLVALEQADCAAMAVSIRVLDEEAERIPHASIRWNRLFHKAWITGLHGDLAEYEHLAEAAFVLGTDMGEPDAATVFAIQFGAVRFYQGRVGELVPIMAQALADTPSLQAYRASLILAKVFAGETDEARQMLDEDRAANFPMRDDTGWTTGLAYWAEAAARLGAVEAARLLRERILPYHDQIVSAQIIFQPALCHYLGLLDQLVGRLDDADRWFAEALMMHERVQSPLLVACTQAAWADLLAERGTGDDQIRARAMAEQALTAGIAGGYGYIERDARTVLDRLG